MHPWLEKIDFGHGISLPSRILPGPMDGVSEGSFVKAMSISGFAHSWFTPFIRISNGVPRRAKLREKLAQYLDTGLPLIVQIMGTRTEFLAETTSRLHEIGVACVDLNCACPSATVLGNKSGGFHLTEPEWIFNTISAMKKACDNKAVSVKIRCGFNSPDEMDNIAEAIRNAAPSMVTCHFRTVRELYKTIPNGWLRLKKMRELLPSTLLIGSGDLFTVDDALRMYEISGVDGVAPARGLMRNPALLLEIEAACAGKSPEEALSNEQRMDFLLKIGELSGKSPARQGFVLKIAREMFGENSNEFQTLLKRCQPCRKIDRATV